MVILLAPAPAWAFGLRVSEAGSGRRKL